MTKITLVSAVICVLSLFSAVTIWGTSRLPDAPLETRVKEADKVFVGVLVNRKELEGDWCHADLKVTKALKGVEVGQLIPVQWRPKTAFYDAKENQEGLAVLKYKDGERYWLRSDTFEDPKLADEVAKSLETDKTAKP